MDDATMNKNAPPSVAIKTFVEKMEIQQQQRIRNDRRVTNDNTQRKWMEM